MLLLSLLVWLAVASSEPTVLPALFVVGLRQLVARLSVAQLLEMQWLGFVR